MPVRKDTKENQIPQKGSNFFKTLTAMQRQKNLDTLSTMSKGSKVSVKSRLFDT